MSTKQPDPALQKDSALPIGAWTDLKSVWCDDAGDPRNFLASFRLRIPATDGAVLLNVAAASVFRVFLDGALIGYGPRRFAKGHSVVNTYPLAVDAKAGSVLVVEVQAYATMSFYIPAEAPFFAAAVYVDGVLTADSAAFAAFHNTSRVRASWRFSFQRHFTECFAMADDPRAFLRGGGSYPPVSMHAVAGNALVVKDLPYPRMDAVAMTEIEAGSLFTPGRPFMHTDYPERVMRPGDAFSPAEIETDPFPLIGRTGYCRETVVERRLGRGYRLYDLGMSRAGLIELELEVAEPAEVFCIFDEVLHEEYAEKLAPNHRNGARELDPLRSDSVKFFHLRLGRGTFHWLSVEPYSIRYLKVVVLSGVVDIRRVGIRLYENPDSGIARFQSADEELNLVFEAARNSFAQSAVDTLACDALRERAAFFGDATLGAAAEAFYTGGRHWLERNHLEMAAVMEPLPNLPPGMIPMCYPADSDGEYIVIWAMFYIIELADYLRRTGDRELIERSEPKVRGILEFLDRYRNPDGLLEDLPGWIFLDWNTPKPYSQGVSYPANMLYVKTLVAAGALYGDADLSMRAEHNRRTILEQAYDGTYFMDHRIREGGVLMPRPADITEACQYYALYSGVADESTPPGFADRVASSLGPGKTLPGTMIPAEVVVGWQLRLDYLAHTRRDAELLEDCRRYFGYMARRSGSLWEMSKASPGSCCSTNCTMLLGGMAGHHLVQALTGYDYDRNAWHDLPVYPVDCRIALRRGATEYTVVIEGGSRRVQIDDQGSDSFSQTRNQERTTSGTLP